MNERTDVRAQLDAANAPTRRTVVRTAAWSLPAVAAVSATPAFAASNQVCTNHTVSFPLNGGTRQSAYSWNKSYTIPGTSEVITLTSTAAYTSGMVGHADTYTTYQNAGALGSSKYGLSLTQRRSQTSVANDTAAQAYRGTYTFTFNKPVKNLKFVVTDIDSNAGDYRDRVAVSGTPALSGFGSRLTSTATGTMANPLRPSSDNQTTSDNDGRGNVTLSYPGVSNSFTLTYWNTVPTVSSGQDGVQGIYVANLSFEYEVCV